MEFTKKILQKQKINTNDWVCVIMPGPKQVAGKCSLSYKDKESLNKSKVQITVYKVRDSI